MPRVWEEHKGCKTCYGSGVHHVLAEGADPNDHIPDYREAYCKTCPAGKLRFVADGGKVIVGPDGQEEWTC